MAMAMQNTQVIVSMNSTEVVNGHRYFAIHDLSTLFSFMPLFFSQ